ncbi:MAG: hypothetical protein ACE5RP_00175 [Nitrosopumilus sp.]
MSLLTDILIPNFENVVIGLVILIFGAVFLIVGSRFLGKKSIVPGLIIMAFGVAWMFFISAIQDIFARFELRLAVYIIAFLVSLAFLLYGKKRRK